MDAEQQQFTSSSFTQSALKENEYKIQATKFLPLGSSKSNA